jgi:hypothetical protein
MELPVIVLIGPCPHPHGSSPHGPCAHPHGSSPHTNCLRLMLFSHPRLGPPSGLPLLALLTKILGEFQTKHTVKQNGCPYNKRPVMLAQVIKCAATLCKNQIQWQFKRIELDRMVYVR